MGSVIEPGQSWMIVEEGETAVTRKEPVEQETSRGIRELLATGGRRRSDPDGR